MKLLKLATGALFCAQCLFGYADVRLPRILADHMVLQRDVPIHIWGWAAPDETVKVTIEKDAVVTSADAIGKWSVILPARPAGGGPLKVTITGNNTIVLDDVLMGDIWLASGQSNMQLPMSGWSSAPVKNSAAEIATANIPDIRLLTVKSEATVYPLPDLKDPAEWQVCTPQTVRDFSAIGFFFGREIHEHVKVPIGLINSTWGGTPVEAWTSLDALAGSAVIAPVMSEHADDMNGEADLLLNRNIEAAVAKAAGKPAPIHADPAQSWGPGTIYNGMIAPFLNMPIKGVVWYQGESNATQARAPYYEAIFETLIVDWRKKWKMPDLPFFFVQIASFRGGANWPVIQDAQRRTLHLNKTGMAVTIDVGEERQIHPENKQVVGHRLALQAEAQVYGENVVKDGPLFKSATPMGRAIKVSFDSSMGLKTKEGSLGGFEVAGADRVYRTATAMIQGDTVVVTSSDVPAPVYVRYAWLGAGWPTGANLYNRADLPASPFMSQYPTRQ